MEPCDPTTCDIPVWLDGTQRWVTGLTKRTTCDDVIYALLYSNGLHETDSTDSYAIFEKWREVERPLSSRTKLVKVWNFWGQEQPNVQLSMRHVEDYFFPGDSSLYLRSRRKHKRSSRLKSRHASHGRYTTRRGCVECTRLKSLEQLVELVVCQERKIQEIQDRIEHTDRMVVTHEARIHQHRVEHNGMDYVQDSYLNSHSSSSSSSIDSSVFTTIDLKKVKSIFPRSSWQDLEDIMRMCEDISDMEKRKSEELLKLNQKNEEMVDLVKDGDVGKEVLLQVTNDELEEARVEMVRAVSTHITQEYNEKELDHKMAVLDEQIHSRQRLLFDLHNQLAVMEETEVDHSAKDFLSRGQENSHDQTRSSFHHPHHHSHHHLQQQQQPKLEEGQDLRHSPIFEPTQPSHLYLDKERQDIHPNNNHCLPHQRHHQPSQRHLQQSEYHSGYHDDHNQNLQQHHHHQQQQQDHRHDQQQQQHRHQRNQQQQYHEQNHQQHHPQNQQHQHPHHHQQRHQQDHPHNQHQRHHYRHPQHLHHPSMQHDHQPKDPVSSYPTAQGESSQNPNLHPSATPSDKNHGSQNSVPSNPRTSRPKSRNGQRSISASGERSMSMERSKSEERVRSQSDTLAFGNSKEHPPTDSNDHARRRGTQESRRKSDTPQRNSDGFRHMADTDLIRNGPSNNSDNNNYMPNGQYLNNAKQLQYCKNESDDVTNTTDEFKKESFSNSNNNNNNNNIRKKIVANPLQNHQKLNSFIDVSMTQKQRREEERTRYDVTTDQTASPNNDSSGDQRKRGENVKPWEFNHIQTEGEQSLSLHRECEQRNVFSNQQEKNQRYLERLLIQQQKQQRRSEDVPQQISTWNDHHKTTWQDNDSDQNIRHFVGADGVKQGNHYFHFDDGVTKTIQNPQEIQKSGSVGDGESGLCYNVKTSKIGVLPNGDGEQFSRNGDVGGVELEYSKQSRDKQFSSSLSLPSNVVDDSDRNLKGGNTDENHRLPGMESNHIQRTGFEKSATESRNNNNNNRHSSNNDNNNNNNNDKSNGKMKGQTNNVKSFPTKLMARFQRNKTTTTIGSNAPNPNHPSSTNDNSNDSNRTTNQNNNSKPSPNSNPQPNHQPDLVLPPTTTPNSHSHPFTVNQKPLTSSSPTDDTNSSNRGALYHILSNKLNKATSKQNASANKTTASLVHQQQHSPSNSSLDSLQDRRQSSKDPNNGGQPYCSSTSSSSTTINAYLSSDDTTSSSNSKIQNEKDKAKDKSVQNSIGKNVQNSNGYLAGNKPLQYTGTSYLVQSSFLLPNSNNSDGRLQNESGNPNRNDNSKTTTYSMPSQPLTPNQSHPINSNRQRNETPSRGVQNPGSEPESTRQQQYPTPSSNKQHQALKSPGSRRRGINPNFCDIITKDSKDSSTNNNGSKNPSTYSDLKPDSSNIQLQSHSHHDADKLCASSNQNSFSTGNEFGNRNINFANVVFGDKGSNPNKQSGILDRKVDVKTILDTKRQKDQISREVQYNSVNSSSGGGSNRKGVAGKNGFIMPAGPGKTKMEDSNDSNSDTGLSSMHSDETANLETLV